MKSLIEKLTLRPGSSVDLGARPTRMKPLYASKREYAQLLQAGVAEMSALQSLLYANSRHSLLIIFQAMDAAGKDGAIRHVMSGVNPQGCQVFSFKHPGPAELAHDFLWRCAQCLPERGRIGIFNRSYYEEVLIVRVHPEILHSEGVPASARREKAIWKQRYRSIVEFERHLHRNGTRIVKFFLHLSREEQRRRFLERIDNPAKNWKLTAADIQERGFWDAYMAAYEACLEATSTAHAPWHIVPADDKENARLIVSQVIVQALRALGMHYPVADDAHRAELAAIRAQLMAEGTGHAAPPAVRVRARSGR